MITVKKYEGNSGYKTLNYTSKPVGKFIQCIQNI